VLSHALIRRPTPITWEEDATAAPPSRSPEDDGKGLVAH
jgi:hypothetical protein